MAVNRDSQREKGNEHPTHPGVKLRIEHLILEGRSKRDADQIAEGLKRELTRLLAEGGVPESWKSGQQIPSINAGEISAQTDGLSDNLGGKIARAVYGGKPK